MLYVLLIGGCMWDRHWWEVNNHIDVKWRNENQPKTKPAHNHKRVFCSYENELRHLRAHCAQEITSCNAQIVALPSSRQLHAVRQPHMCLCDYVVIFTYLCIFARHFFFLITYKWKQLYLFEAPTDTFSTFVGFFFSLHDLCCHENWNFNSKDVDDGTS